MNGAGGIDQIPSPKIGSEVYGVTPRFRSAHLSSVWDVLENFENNTKSFKKHPGGWKNVLLLDDVLCLVSLPNKNTHKKLKKISMFLSIDTILIQSYVTPFFKVIQTPDLQTVENFRPKILQPSLNLPC